LAGDLSLSGVAESARHVVHVEFGGESESGVLGLASVFKAQRLNADEVLVAVRSDSWVRGELDACGGGHINASGNELETGLLLSVADVDGDLGRAEVLQRRGSAVVLPGDGGLLSTAEGR